MTWTLCTSGAAIVKAGAYANSTIIASGSSLAGWSDEAEGYIVSATRRNWVTSYSSLSASIKNALSNAASSLIAKQIISYDMSGFTSRAEAQTMLDVQDDTARSAIQELKDFNSNTIKTP